MAYLPESQYIQMRRFSTKEKIPMSQLIREAIDIRISKGDPYIQGFNEALDKALKALNENKAAQMRFPSGKSFAELIGDELELIKMKENQ
jgi:hypothetical protein